MLKHHKKTTWNIFFCDTQTTAPWLGQRWLARWRCVTVDLNVCGGKSWNGRSSFDVQMPRAKQIPNLSKFQFNYTIVTRIKFHKIVHIVSRNSISRSRRSLLFGQSLLQQPQLHRKPTQAAHWTTLSRHSVPGRRVLERSKSEDASIC